VADRIDHGLTTVVRLVARTLRSSRCCSYCALPWKFRSARNTSSSPWLADQFLVFLLVFIEEVLSLLDGRLVLRLSGFLEGGRGRVYVLTHLQRVCHIFPSAKSWRLATSGFRTSISLKPACARLAARRVPSVLVHDSAVRADPLLFRSHGGLFSKLIVQRRILAAARQHERAREPLLGGV